MIAEGEHQQQDFKTRIDDSRKIARTLVAFANADGGRLLVGVKDNGTVSGVRVDEELHMIEAAAEMYCQPAVEFRTQVWKADVRSVLEVVVEPSRQRPHRSEDEEGQWNTYLRLEDENIRVNAVLSRCWDHRFRADRPAFEYDRHVGRLFRTWRKGKLLGSARSCARSGAPSRPPRTCLPCWWVGASSKWCWATATSCMALRTSRRSKTSRRRGRPCSTSPCCLPRPASGD